MTDHLKKCRQCGVDKPATTQFFEKHRQCRGGITSRCKVCANARAKRWRDTNQEAIAQRWQERYGVKNRTARKLRDRYYREHQPARALANTFSHRIRTRAFKHKLPIDLAVISRESMLKLILDTPSCPCCGREFEFRPGIPSGQKSGFRRCEQLRTRSVDKLIPSLGYVRGNIAIICWRCNALKRDADWSEIVALANWLSHALADEQTYTIKDDTYGNEMAEAHP